MGKRATLFNLFMIVALLLGVLPTSALATPAAAPVESVPAPVGLNTPSTYSKPIKATQLPEFGPVPPVEGLDPAGILHLLNDTGNAVQISISPATNAVRFVRLSAGHSAELSEALGSAQPVQEQVNAFFNQYGSIFGIKNAAAELTLDKTEVDQLGYTHLTFNQVYQGVPVFAGVMRVHFNDKNQMTAVNGVFIPNIFVSPKPSFDSERTAQIALAEVNASGATVRSNKLYIFRANLAKGVPGPNHLVYEVEVSDDVTVRDYVYVDAHTGLVVDRIAGIKDIYREIYSSTYNVANLIWKDGDPPYAGGDVDVARLITYTGNTYDMVANATHGAWLSFDGADAGMIAVAHEPTMGCPNAHWIGTRTEFCTGVTGDDTVAHEWGHAYTDYTHNLIYQWQPGALNESYADIFGEVVDLINGSGLDAPGGLRTAGTCSAYTNPTPILRINAPPAIAGDYPVGGAQFGPLLTLTGTTALVAAVNDGTGHPEPPSGAAGDLSLLDGCDPLVNAGEINGKIAFVYRGNCTFVVKVKNAQDAGAIGVIVSNHTTGGDALITMAGDDPTIVIPSVFVGNTNGNAIYAQLVNNVNATLKLSGGTTFDDSYRWLSGEDDPAFGGAIRDMWLPSCYLDPDKVSDTLYACGTDDQGGVHKNSGVPNHAFALMTDGGIYNGQTISPGLGLTKTFAIYWRAESVYQTPSSGFADHADALETSCDDLVGASLYDLTTGITSTAVITDSDCVEVADAIAAAELRTPPTQCNFQPLLDPSTPPLCGLGLGPAAGIFTDTFETVMTTTWTLTNTGVYPVYDPRDWEWRDSLPGGRSGHAFYAVDGLNIGNCDPGTDDQSGVMYLTSPAINIPTTTTNLNMAFDHYVATEVNFDGGNLWISVNGGAWQPVARADFTFNPYNATLATSGGGNTNPLAGQWAFHGSDGGVVTGSWATSLVNLDPYAVPGDAIQLRFALGVDGCNGLDGWYVDDVRVYTCQGMGTPTWEKEIWINSAQYGPAQSPFSVVNGDVVTIVDRVSVSSSKLVTYTLDEEWTDSLGFVDYQATDGVVITGANTLAWSITQGMTDTWYVLTKTFQVNDMYGWMDYVTETLTVEGWPSPIVIPLEFNLAAKLSKDAPATAETGEVIPYTIVISAANPIALNGTAMLTDALPSGVQYAGGLTATYGSAWYISGTNTVYWNNASGMALAALAPAVTSAVPDSRPATVKKANVPPVKLYDLQSPQLSLTLFDLATLLEEGFEGGVMPPTGWSVINGNSSTRHWQLVDTGDNPAWIHSGTYAGWVNYEALDQDEWLISPLLNLIGVQTPMVDFWVYANNNWVSFAELQFLVIDGGGVFTDTLWQQSDETWPYPSTYHQVQVDLSSYTSAPVYLAWRYVGNDGDSFALDDIRVVGEVAPLPSVVTITFNVTVTALPGAEIVNVVNLNYDGAMLTTAVTTQVPPTTHTLDIAKVGNGTVTKNPDQANYLYGTVVTLTATPDPGWTFDSWSGGIVSTADVVTLTIMADTLVTATFSQAPTYTLMVVITPTGAGSVALNPAGGVYQSGTVVTLTATPDSGWSFAGWSGGLVGNPTHVTITENTVVTATFSQALSYTLTVVITPTGAGSVALNPAGGVYQSGTVVTLTATANPGWMFKEWSGALTGSTNPDSLVMNANQTVTAIFERSYKIFLPIVMRNS